MKRRILTLTLIGALALAATATAANGPSDRLIGGGWIDNPEFSVGRVTLGFQLPCGIDNPDFRPTLQVNWRRSTFTLKATALDVCQGAGERGAVSGFATGTCNGAPATARFSFSNAGIAIEGVPYYPNAVQRLEIAGSARGCALALTNTGLTGGTFRFIDNPDI